MDYILTISCPQDKDIDGRAVGCATLTDVTNNIHNYLLNRLSMGTDIKYMTFTVTKGS